MPVPHSRRKRLFIGLQRTKDTARKQYILAQNFFQHSSGNSAGTEDYRLPMAKVKYGGFKADITGATVKD